VNFALSTYNVIVRGYRTFLVASSCAFFLVVFFSCQSISRNESHSVPQATDPDVADVYPTDEPHDDEPGIERSVPDRLTLTFAGDIMAHTVNSAMPDYGRIYESIAPVLREDDLTFGNLEVPIVDNLPFSTYPRFNTHSPYLAAAIAGGFDVFSLANNHANDQGVVGTAGTLSALESAGNGAYWSGLRKNSGDAIEPVLIKSKGWKILFLAVTEILNSYDAAGKNVYYVAPRPESRAAFIDRIRAMRGKYQPDAFILSLHSDEPEYVRTANDEKKSWFRELSLAGVDVVWGHHPHVMQPWESVQSPRTTGMSESVFMYSQGNFISGQRENPDLKNPKGLREYTGDAVLLRLTLEREFPGARITTGIANIPVTNYTDPSCGPVVRPFVAEFVDSLSPTFAQYYRERYALLRAYLPSLPLIENRDILER
jgi:poly-gamma-glutamate synthesis protein (capsule biosynthesis protein)